MLHMNTSHIKISFIIKAPQCGTALACIWPDYYIVVYYFVVYARTLSLGMSPQRLAIESRSLYEEESMKVSYAKVGTYIGAGIGLLLFVVVWMLPVSYIGGVSGSRVQEYISGSSQGIISAAIMALIVLASGLFVTSVTAVAGWIGGTAVGALKAAAPESKTIVEPIGTAAVQVEEA